MTKLLELTSVISDVFTSDIKLLAEAILTAWSRVIPEKLTVSQLVKKFPAFYGTRRFITAFMSARHLFLY